jgi:AcrR family transcriptional regulator
MFPCPSSFLPVAINSYRQNDLAEVTVISICWAAQASKP